MPLSAQSSRSGRLDFVGMLERVLDGAAGCQWLAATVLATSGVAVLTLAAAGDASLSAPDRARARLRRRLRHVTIVAKRLFVSATRRSP